MVVASTVLSNEYLIWLAAEVVSIAIIVWFVIRWRPGFLRGHTISQSLNQALDARSQQIQGQLEAAEVSRREAAKIREQAAADIERARAEGVIIVERAAQTSQAVLHEMEVKAQEEYHRIVAQAHDEIEYERRQAEAALRQRASDIVVDAAGQIVRQYLEPSSDRRIIDTSLDEMREIS